MKIDAKKAFAIVRGTAAAILIISTVSFISSRPADAAGDVQAGKTSAAACAGCHGADGHGVAPNPALAGKKEDQIIQALKDYKSGKRDNPIMKGMASALSDQEIANVAAYFASLK